MSTQIKSATPAAASIRDRTPACSPSSIRCSSAPASIPSPMFYKLPYWPGPWESASTIVPFFQTQGARVLVCMFLQLGAFICLGLFTATSRQPPALPRRARRRRLHRALRRLLRRLRRHGRHHGHVGHDPSLCRSACRCCDRALLSRLRSSAGPASPSPWDFSWPASPSPRPS